MSTTPDGSLAARYQVPGMPSSYLFGPDGELAGVPIGFRNGTRAEREAELERLLSGLLFNPAPKRITMVGLGGGSLAKFCYRNLREAHITVVEIDPRVIALRDEFCIPADDERFRIVCEDGAHYISQRTDPIDVLLVDAFDLATRVQAAHSATDDREIRIARSTPAIPPRTRVPAVLAPNLPSIDFCCAPSPGGVVDGRLPSSSAPSWFMRYRLPYRRRLYRSAWEQPSRCWQAAGPRDRRCNPPLVRRTSRLGRVPGTHQLFDQQAAGKAADDRDSLAEGRSVFSWSSQQLQAPARAIR